MDEPRDPDATEPTTNKFDEFVFVELARALDATLRHCFKRGHALLAMFDGTDDFVGWKIVINPTKN